MGVVRVSGLTFAYPGAVRPALRDVSFELEGGEVVAVLGSSGSGKSTLLRALSGLVPHFHGGRFSGCVEVAGADTRRVRPAELAGTVATVFQDPEDQVVMTVVETEVAFGLENVGRAPEAIWPSVREALGAVGISHLARRRTTAVSSGELQRVCLASALAFRPRLLVLDEPLSQLDPEGADEFLRCVAELDATVVLCEHRVERALAVAARVLFLDDGRLTFDGSTDEAERWLAAHHPAYVSGVGPDMDAAAPPSDPVVTIENIWFGYSGTPVLRGDSLEVRRGEVVALEGPNGSGKTTLAKLAVGLLRPDSGVVDRAGRAGYLSQDPGRYVACDTALAEVALAVDGDERRARAALDAVGLAWAEARHPRDLSSGERERLALAAVAAPEPDLLVLDEPTRGVDPARKIELAEWLHAYAAHGRGVLVATHDRAFPVDRRVSVGAGRNEVLVGA